jgi:hypothetical protein
MQEIVTGELGKAPPGEHRTWAALPCYVMNLP